MPKSVVIACKVVACGCCRFRVKARARNQRDRVLPQALWQLILKVASP